MKKSEEKKRLANYLGINPADLQSGSGYSYTTKDGREYLVETEEEAYKETRNYIIDTMKELGFEAFTKGFRYWILDNAIDETYFKNTYRDCHYLFADDLARTPSSHGYENELIDDMVSSKLLTAKDFRVVDGVKVVDRDLDALKQEYVEDLLDDVSSIYKWLDDFGWDDLFRFATDNDAIDYDVITDECISKDGRGHFLASYDGKEIDLGNGLFAYRID